MTAFTKIPTYLDCARQLAEQAAALAGYDLDQLLTHHLPKDDPRAQLHRQFIDKGFEAARILGPAAVELDAIGDKLPDDVWKAGKARDEHMITIARGWRGMTVEQLALAAGLSVALLEAIEARQVAANEMHEAAIGAVLGMNPNALTDWGELVPGKA